jgi:hypothetical protein
MKLAYVPIPGATLCYIGANKDSVNPTELHQRTIPMLTRKIGSNVFSRIALLGLLSAAPLVNGCASDSTDPSVEVDEEGYSSDDIVKLDNTLVKRQSIGNCWLYATASWVESLHKAQSGKDINTSESYWTYWHWFEQIANSGYRDEISTGGSIGTATGLIIRYGYMLEGEFLPAEAEAEMSGRQKSALDAINLSLKSGALKDRAVRTDRAKVRAELDKAFGLSPQRVAALDAVFGKGVTRTLDKAFRTRRPGNQVFRARDLEVKLPDPVTKAPTKTTLAEAIGTGSEWSRTGKFAWKEVDFPYTPTDRRKFIQKVQRSLHAGAPVVISWKVDFNALTSDSRFSKQKLEMMGPGRQGGHMTLITDYEATLKDGTKLKQGVVATPAQLEAALKDDTKIDFLYVKNSWGGFRPDRWQNGVGELGQPGYHALMMDYLEGPIKDCVEVNGTSDPNNCRPTTPLWDVYVPAGFDL